MPEPSDKENPQPSAPIEAIPVVVIQRGTGDGGAPMTTGTIGKTPDHQKNFVASAVITPAVAVTIRCCTVFFQTLMAGLGLASGATLTGAIPWANWRVAVIFACSAAAVCAIQSLVTIFGNLEKKYPLLGAV